MDVPSKSNSKTEYSSRSQQKQPSDQQMFKMTRCLQIYQSLTPRNSSSCTKDLTKLFTKLEVTASSSQEKEQAFVVEILNTIDRLLSHITHTENIGISTSMSYGSNLTGYRNSLNYESSVSGY